MSRYMKHKFVFFGLKAAQRRQAAKGVMDSWSHRHTTRAGSLALEEVLGQATRALNACSEREMHYVAAELCARHLQRTQSWEHPAQARALLDVAREAIVTNSWWDTVDVLATSGVGGALVAPGARRAGQEVILEELEQWSTDNDMWLRRAAILSQIKCKESTNTALLER